MPDTMTRIQAICACRNIQQLAEDLGNAPEDFRSSLRERAASMEQGITDNTRYARVTEKMDSALRNMWNGLKRWDRDEEYIDDLFEDLEEVEKEIADLDAAPKEAPKGRENHDGDKAAKQRAAALRDDVDDAEASSTLSPACSTPSPNTSCANRSDSKTKTYASNL